VQRVELSGRPTSALEPGDRGPARVTYVARVGVGEKREQPEKETLWNGKFIKPSLNHYGLIAGQLAEMKAWHETVIGTITVHESDHPLGEEVKLPFKIRAALRGGV